MPVGEQWGTIFSTRYGNFGGNGISIIILSRVRLQFINPLTLSDSRWTVTKKSKLMQQNKRYRPFYYTHSSSVSVRSGCVVLVAAKAAWAASVKQKWGAGHRGLGTSVVSNSTPIFFFILKLLVISLNWCCLKRNHLRQYIQFPAAPSGATKGLMQHFTHMQYYFLRPKNRLCCVILVEFPFNFNILSTSFTVYQWGYN